jgi:hypothetical protein
VRGVTSAAAYLVAGYVLVQVHADVRPCTAGCSYQYVWAFFSPHPVEMRAVCPGTRNTARVGHHSSLPVSIPVLEGDHIVVVHVKIEHHLWPMRGHARYPPVSLPWLTPQRHCLTLHPASRYHTISCGPVLL